MEEYFSIYMYPQGKQQKGILRRPLTPRAIGNPGSYPTLPYQNTKWESMLEPRLA